MRLKSLEINGFKSFAHKSVLEFESSIICIVGPNGSGKSNVVESFRYVLGEQSMKSMRGKSGTDLIFKGSKKLSKGSRATVTIHFNNEDKVFKVSNDSGENIDLNYETVSIARQVFPDGLNKYILNGTDVRLKDIHNLLASVNIGSSGHHIISQGEADRILNANTKDRREMVEDALGLKVYQYRIKESEKKLERTNENMKEVSMLRRENAPHLNFLRKQVEKFEKAKEMQSELGALYREYLKRESLYLEKEKSSSHDEKNKISIELKEVAGKISATEEENSTEGSKKIDELRTHEKKINEIRSIKNDMERKLGRIEGMIEMEEHRARQAPEAVVMSEVEVKSILSEVNSSIEEAISKDDVREIRGILERIKIILNRFNKNKEVKENFTESLELKKTRQEILIEMDKIDREEHKMLDFVAGLRKEIEEEMSALRDLEREKFGLKVRHQELASALELIHIKESNLRSRLENFENEIREGVALIGQEI
ncbi:MAG: AAA family ATPase, partial [Patescibacteria group bacterium]